MIWKNMKEGFAWSSEGTAEQCVVPFTEQVRAEDSLCSHEQKSYQKQQESQKDLFSVHHFLSRNQ
jgi:hypothetical protein